jgi:NADH-quinone oxidoreductase subunit G
MIQLTIDGQKISVPSGTTVYTAAKQLGIDVPIFCYHDRMPPFGACRVCLVEVNKMGKLQTSCTLQVTEGMEVKTQSALAAEGRKEILEFLLINHPLDCPICDRAGECPLQDQTLRYGPGLSEFFEEKRRFKKPLPLGPLLMLDRERCIICARCTRYSDIVVGDHALEMKDRGFKTEVGTPENQPIESKFICNTIDICPVGALTSQVYRFRARPWDNDTTETTCTLCPVGCSLNVDSRDQEVMRTRPSENHSINDTWLCDKGAFGYEFASHPDRLKTPLLRKDGVLTPITWEEAFLVIEKEILAKRDSGKVAALGGNALTLEENFLFQKLVREGFLSNNIDHRVGMPIISVNDEGLTPGMEILLGDCPDLSFAIILGLDPTEEFPILWLRLREAINRGAQTFFLGHHLPEIAPHLTKVIAHAPGEELSQLQALLPTIESLIKKGGKGAIFIGSQYLNTKNRTTLLSELLKVQTDQTSLSINIMEGRGGSLGARISGVHPELKPCGEHLPKAGLNTIELLEKMANEKWDYLHVVSSNPAAILPQELWKKARANLQFLVVQDLFLTETAKQADLVLPTFCFLEKNGHFLNIAGQLQKICAGEAIPGSLFSDGEIFEKIAEKLNLTLAVDPQFIHKIQHSRGRGTNIPNQLNNEAEISPHEELGTEGTLSATFAPVLFDGGVRMLHNSHLAKLVKEPKVRIHPEEGKKRSLNDGDTVKLSCNKAVIDAIVKLDRRVAAGTLFVPLGFDQLNACALSPYLINGKKITVVKQT